MQSTAEVGQLEHELSVAGVIGHQLQQAAGRAQTTCSLTIIRFGKIQPAFHKRLEVMRRWIYMFVKRHFDRVVTEIFFHTNNLSTSDRYEMH